MTIESDYKSSLNVKFNFKDEVAPKNYSAVRERLAVPQNHVCGDTLLSQYLKENERIEYSKNYVKDWSLNKFRDISIKSNPKKMTLEVSVSSEENLSKDELLNLGNLNEFILTGEYPLKGQEKIKQAYKELNKRDSK